MIETVSNNLLDDGIDKTSILFELFSSSVKSEEIKGKTESTSLEIIYDELTHKFENMDSKSVLDTALQNNLKVPYSCQGGFALVASHVSNLERQKWLPIRY